MSGGYVLGEKIGIGAAVAVNNNARVTADTNVTIKSDTAGASANTDLVSGGVMSVGVTEADSQSKRSSTAYLGNVANVTAAAGDINVIAFGRGEAELSVNNSGGVVQIGVAHRTSKYGPTVEARVSDDTVLKAGDDVTVDGHL